MNELFAALIRFPQFLASGLISVLIGILTDIDTFFIWLATGLLCFVVNPLLAISLGLLLFTVLRVWTDITGGGLKAVASRLNLIGEQLNFQAVVFRDNVQNFEVILKAKDTEETEETEEEYNGTERLFH